MSFKLKFEVCRLGVARRSDCSLFHSLGSTTPTVDSLYLGTTSRLSLLDLRVRAGTYGCTNSARYLGAKNIDDVFKIEKKTSNI